MKTEANTTTKIDWTKPIETTDGYPARLISEDFRASKDQTVRLVQIEYPQKSDVRLIWPDGSHGVPYAGNIRNRKTKREGWINIFNNHWVGALHKTEEEALREEAVDGALATLKIEWEQ